MANVIRPGELSVMMYDVSIEFSLFFHVIRMMHYVYLFSLTTCVSVAD
jgi:hypothetical protein